MQITDSWLEFSIALLCGRHDIYGLKDRITRDILSGLDAANIGIDARTYDTVGTPPVRIEGPGKRNA